MREAGKVSSKSCRDLAVMVTGVSLFVVSCVLVDKRVSAGWFWAWTAFCNSGEIRREANLPDTRQCLQMAAAMIAST